MVYDSESFVINTAGDVSEVAELKDTKEQLMLYVKENQRLVNELRELRHSSINIIHGINGFIELEDWDGLKKYFNDVLEGIKNTPDTSFSSIEKVLNHSLKKLLHSKLNDSISSGIDTKVMVDDNILIENNLISETDLCNVISEFVNSAIESASQAVSKKVSIYILNCEKSVSIIIENTFKEKPNMSINNPQFTKAEGWGSGIQPASMILSKYPNVLKNTFMQHQVFVRELQIFK